MTNVKDLSRETLEAVYGLSPYEWTDSHQAFCLGYQMAKPKWVSIKRDMPAPYELALWALPDIGIIIARLSDFSYGVQEQEDVFWMALPEEP